MTDEQILATADACGMMLFGLGLDKAKFEFCILAFAKQIAKLERHHEREALAQPEQEPVAWMDADGNVSDNNDHKCFPIPLYTTPPQRTWVDLTRTQIQDVYFKVLEEHRGGHQMEGQLAFGEALQAKLKEKNNA
jgi:hypothetical protein